MQDNKIIFAKSESLEMLNAFNQAQKTFKYFWRELSWEYRRVVPALDLTIVKVAFAQQFEGRDSLTFEHMWIDEIEFNGDFIQGVLMNTPNYLTNVSNGDNVKITLSQMSDWMFVCEGKTYGGFTVHAIRAAMKEDKRQEHDKAWGLDFGDSKNILIANGQNENPENLEEHPMCVNMQLGLKDFIKENPSELNVQDEAGFTLLHRAVIAGNTLSVQTLLELGANKLIPNKQGKIALDIAQQLNWNRIIEILK